MPEKKRKAQSDHDIRPHKKHAPETPNSTIEVKLLEGPDVTRPVIASTPGVSLSSDVRFTTFTKPDASGNHKLLLHSSEHPTVDYFGTGEESHHASQIKHYMAVYDPGSGTLQVTPARKMTIRSCVRQRKPTTQREDEEENEAAKPSGRAALTQAFGTKKSKKLAASAAENARLVKDGPDNQNNLLSKALLSSVPLHEVSDGIGQATASIVQAHKPLPVPDLATTDVSQVYPLSSLVFPEPATSTLAQMPISDWLTTREPNEDIQLTSRFVAHNINRLIRAVIADPSSSSAKQPLRILRYIMLLLDLARFLKSTRSGKPIGPMANWAPKIPGADSLPRPLLGTLVRRYCPENLGLDRFNTDLLHTTILALTLHITPPSGNHGKDVLATEPTCIMLDLNLRPDEIRRFFRELGCRFEPATEAELMLWGYGKKKDMRMDGNGHYPRFAKLKLPLEFPVRSQGPPPNAKKRR